MKKKTTIIALAGKGGVGKTSLAAAMVRMLMEKYPGRKILAIDADPAVGLATALGITVSATVDEIRREIVDSVQENGAKAAVELLGEARYRILEALEEPEGFSFLAIGRPEAAGCYCKVNNFLKDIITAVADNFDYVVIDGEAGIEQINRRVMEKVTHLVMVTDTSKKGADVTRTIRKVAQDLVMADSYGVIVNRIPSADLLPYMELGDIPILSLIGTDDELMQFDLTGRSVFERSSDVPLMRGAAEALEKLML